MKRILLFGALSMSFIGSAQLTQGTEPVIGEMRSMFLCDSFTVNQSGVVGPAVTWDFTGLAGFPGETRDIIVSDATLAPNAADFPSSVYALSVGNMLTTYYTTSATDKISQGFVFNEPSLGDVVAKFSSDAETVVTYPFAYGSSLNDAFSGDLDYVLGTPQTAALTGMAYAWIDAEGTLNLPGAVSLPNVLRYKIIDTSWATIPLFGSMEIIRTQYEYYAPTVAPDYLPVLTFSTIVVQNVGQAPITELSLVLSAYQPENNVSIDEKVAVEFSVYPNPSNDLVTISGNLSADATATIIDQSGRKLKSMSASNGTLIDLSAFENGIYFLTIEDNGSISTKNIVKN